MPAIQDPNTVLTLLGTRIKQAREDKGWRVAKLAAEIDITVRALDRVEQGHGLRSERLPLLAEVLDVSLDWLFGLTDEPTPVEDLLAEEAAT